jgi:hypothetical protein
MAAIRAELASFRLFFAEEGAAVAAAEQAPPPHDGAAAERELEEAKADVKDAKRGMEIADAKVEAAEAEVKEAQQKVNAPAQNPPARPPGPHQSRPRLPPVSRIASYPSPGPFDAQATRRRAETGGSPGSPAGGCSGGAVEAGAG